MKIELLGKPGVTSAKIELNINEKIVAEAGAMIAMSNSISVYTEAFKRSQGGVFGALKRMVGGESFFLNTFTASKNGDILYLGSENLGDMIVKNINSVGIIVQSGSFLAAEQKIKVDVGWQGFKNFISGENLFWLKITGFGSVILNSYGAIYEIDVIDEYIVDTGHIVAFEETLNFEITKAGDSWINSFLGGEGFVCKFKGRGKLWCQSHNFNSLGSEVGPYLTPR